MDFFTALNELEISSTDTNKLEKERLKKCYHTLALKWHPDKNKDKIELATKKFQRITFAYNYLIDFINSHNNSESNINHSNTYNDFVSLSSNELPKNYIYFLSNFISSLFGGAHSEIIHTIITRIVLDYENATYSFLTTHFEKLDKYKAVELYKILYKYKDVLYISNEVIELVSSIVREKFEKGKENDRVFILQPRLIDVINHNIYKLYVDNTLYLVPLWHSELYFDAKDGSELIVLCQPKLPENVTIDDNCNICCSLNVRVTNKMLNNNNEVVSLNLDGAIFLIPIDKLRIKKEQIYRLHGEGISSANIRNIYNITHKSDIIVKIQLEIGHDD